MVCTHIIEKYIKIEGKKQEIVYFVSIHSTFCVHISKLKDKISDTSYLFIIFLLCYLLIVIINVWTESWQNKIDIVYKWFMSFVLLTKINIYFS